MPKKKKAKKDIEMHQHVDSSGNKFGKIHPKEAYHKKFSTYMAHLDTLER